MTACLSFVLDVARYAFEPTANNLLNNQIKSFYTIMNDLA
ncbi:hypothetical protein HMPREF3226_02747 [Prevotella corporis]|uniref:Uncharacterized protein n=1 Tax=Prevotella corporis TaxID=28128 RepID=A0A133PTX0_9BACT|nr:hypothetical protein HMPREF3226_02747 [Prevotella corporis]